ncbi:hypothetical protein, conserved [Trypanosoma vivax Y486]|uniref:Reverse transcriptase domain-containing protein n=1 Tax=Trypanosoma vivax (strain Y486) TaxID=1055687 RepID=F9WUM4_TRYVY|nr:hypothetical protein, conserved [Trypanosoma vivax Y486]|eukprot:CCD21273.1 hypothetical protein, conserved [Trypanosoma vivax Y486]
MASSKHARATHAWNKVRWHEFRKLSDEFIFRRMGRSAKGADAMNEAVTRGIRMAAKRTLPTGKGVGPPFWTPELTKLDVAQREPSSDTAPDDDEVNCEELEQLGRETKKCVVRLFNCSLRTLQVPSAWGHGIIVPLLKPNKPASSMASFRPATLKGTLRKLMERIAARRVGDCIEDKLQPQRAGFRPARSTLDTPMQRARRSGGRAVLGASRRRLCSVTVRVPSTQRIAVGIGQGAFCPSRCWEVFGCVDRRFSEGARGAGEGERHAVGGCQPHLLCPSGLVAGAAAVHCRGGLAERVAELHPWAAARVLRGRPHNCVHEC